MGRVCGDSVIASCDHGVEEAAHALLSSKCDEGERIGLNVS
jgi:hypothetical protein